MAVPTGKDYFPHWDSFEGVEGLRDRWWYEKQKIRTLLKCAGSLCFLQH